MQVPSKYSRTAVSSAPAAGDKLIRFPPSHAVNARAVYVEHEFAAVKRIIIVAAVSLIPYMSQVCLLDINIRSRRS